jgi:hypothetical protein
MVNIVIAVARLASSKARPAYQSTGARSADQSTDAVTE